MKPRPRATKSKVMVYLDPDLRRGMSVLAAERGMRTSDLYAEAVAEFLQTWRRPGGRTSVVEQVGPAPSTGVPVDDALHRITKKLDGHSQMIVEIQTYARSLLPEVETRALAIVIAAVLNAGPEGIETPAVRSALAKEGFRGLKPATVREALLQAGVLARNDERWRVRDPFP